MALLYDTSILIAAFCSWHQAHRPSLNHWLGMLDSDEDVLVAAHSLVECYSVLTRLPTPHRLSCSASFQLVQANLAERNLVSLAPEQYLETLADCERQQVGGGTVYDALIVKAAVVGGASSIVTLNARHFQRLAPSSVSVIEPR
jgi:predicted nucleic acid-binding protein